MKEEETEAITTSNETERELTPIQLQCIPFLAKARTETEGCKLANISRTTLFFWKKIPAFARMLQDARQELVNISNSIMREHQVKASEELVKLAFDKKTPIWLKSDLLKYIRAEAKQHTDGKTLEDRLEKLERVIIEKRTYR